MRHLWTAVRLAGWLVVAALGILAVLRVVAWDARVPVLLGIHGLGPLPYLFALPVAVLALIRRHVRLGSVALAVAAVALPTGLPEVTASEETLGARSAPGMRVLSWNVHQTNTDVAAIERVVRDANADIVLLQEVSAASSAALRSSPVMTAYRHSFSTPPAAFGSGMWSRLPLEGAEQFDVGGLPMSRAIVRTAVGPVRLVNVHALSPTTEDGLTVWPRQLRALGEEARRPGPPIVMAGDFNATWGHRPFRQLLDAGLQDAAAARGVRWGPTWPAGRKLIPPILRIDHVLTGPGLAATRYRTGEAGGSDHRSIVVDVVIEPART